MVISPPTEATDAKPPKPLSFALSVMTRLPPTVVRLIPAKFQKSPLQPETMKSPPTLFNDCRETPDMGSATPVSLTLPATLTICERQLPAPQSVAIFGQFSKTRSPPMAVISFMPFRLNSSAQLRKTMPPSTVKPPFRKNCSVEVRLLPSSVSVPMTFSTRVLTYERSLSDIVLPASTIVRFCTVSFTAEPSCGAKASSSSRLEIV